VKPLAGKHRETSAVDICVDLSDLADFIDAFRSASSGAPCAVQPMRPDTDGERSEGGYPGTFVSSRKCCPREHGRL
jgi:hypothetical protein